MFQLWLFQLNNRNRDPWNTTQFNKRLICVLICLDACLEGIFKPEIQDLSWLESRGPCLRSSPRLTVLSQNLSLSRVSQASRRMLITRCVCGSDSRGQEGTVRASVLHKRTRASGGTFTSRLRHAGQESDSTRGLGVWTGPCVWGRMKHTENHF